MVGLSLVSRTGDIGLQKAASRVSAKIDLVRSRVESLQVSDWGVPTPKTDKPETLRSAIRDEQKLSIHYRDENQIESNRSILPITIIYYVEIIVLVAWCELRDDFRHFRVDRMISCEPGEDYFSGNGNELRQRWQASTNGF